MDYLIRLFVSIPLRLSSDILRNRKVLMRGFGLRVNDLILLQQELYRL